MKKYTVSFISIMIVSVLSTLYADPYDLSNINASAKIKAYIQNDTLKWINNNVIIDEVKKANRINKNRSQAMIDQFDTKWKKSRKLQSFMLGYLTNPAAKFLKDKQRSSGGKIAEIIVMDFQGCNVAISSKTSDFWQGDEAKFKKSYNNGNGAVFVDKEEYDESTKTTIVQISLPIIDPASKKVIGAITIGVVINNL